MRDAYNKVMFYYCIIICHIIIMSLLPQYKQTNQRADAPETTEWQDIFHKKFEGTHAHAVYEKIVEAENVQQEMNVREECLKANVQRTLQSDSSSFSDELD